MKNPTLSLEHKDANKERLLAIADQIPGAWIGIKIAALLLVLEGQRPGWITEVFGLTRMRPKSLDSRCKQRWHRVLETQAQSRKNFTVRAESPKSTCSTFGEVSKGIWIKPRTVGWANVSDSSKAFLWNKHEGTTSPTMDAPSWISSKAGKLLVSSSTEPRSTEISEGFKKNLSPLSRMKPSSSRMRQDSRCTLD